MEIRYEAKHTTLETHPIVGKIMALGKPDLIERSMAIPIPLRTCCIIVRLC